MRNIKDADMYRGLSGIYYIIEEHSSRVYVGSSVDVRRRVLNHYTNLKSGTHKNSYLQRVWDKSGEGKFIFGLIESVPEEGLLLKREQHWMDFFKSFNRERGFNLTPTAGSNLGYKKTKEQIMNSVKALRGKRNTILTEREASSVKTMINEGLALTEIAKRMGVEYETVRSVRRGNSHKHIEPQIDYDMCMRTKLSGEDVVHIKNRINKDEKVGDIARDYDVSHRTISAIKNEITWKNVGEKITAKKRRSRKGDNEMK